MSVLSPPSPPSPAVISPTAHGTPPNTEEQRLHLSLEDVEEAENERKRDKIGGALTVHVGVRGFKGAKFIFLGHTLIQKSAGRYSADKHSPPTTCPNGVPSRR